MPAHSSPKVAMARLTRREKS